MLSFLRQRTRIVLVAAGLTIPVGGMVALAATAPAVSAKSKCPKGKKHFKTPHKDLDRDHCDSRGVDDGDGAKV